MASSILAQFIGAIGLLGQAAAITMSGTLQLEHEDYNSNVLVVDPGGADRALKLWAEETSEGHLVLIANTADATETITVANDAAATVTTLPAGTAGLFRCTSSTWSCVARWPIFGSSGELEKSTVLIADNDVLYSDTSPKTIYTVPSGKLLVLHHAIAITEVAWNGSGADLDVGDTGDPDGITDGSGVTIASTGTYGDDPAERGAYLYNSTDKYPKLKTFAAAGVIKATITPGSGATTGRTRVLLFGILVDA